MRFENIQNVCRLERVVMIITSFALLGASVDVKTLVFAKKEFRLAATKERGLQEKKNCLLRNSIRKGLKYFHSLCRIQSVTSTHFEHFIFFKRRWVFRLSSLTFWRKTEECSFEVNWDSLSSSSTSFLSDIQYRHGTQERKSNDVWPQFLCPWRPHVSLLFTQLDISTLVKATVDHISAKRSDWPRRRTETGARKLYKRASCRSESQY